MRSRARHDEPLCNLRDLCVSVVNVFLRTLTTEAQRTQRGHRVIRVFSWLAVGALFSLFIAASSVHAQSTAEGQALFGSKCYSCHNIGSGDKQGPDLKGVTTRRTKDWLKEFINTPAAVNSKGDPVATELFKKFSPNVMPDQALTPEQIDSLLALITDLTNKNQVYVPAGAKLSRAIVPTDVDGGWRFFTGRVALQNGGSACISCHSVKGIGMFGGGTLGPDLTGASIKYRDPELISILQNPNFPTMSTVFATHRLNDEEIVQLFALFQDAKLKHPVPPPQTGITTLDPRFFVIGVASMLLVLALLNLAWRNRLRGVREELLVRTGSGSDRVSSERITQ